MLLNLGQSRRRLALEPVLECSVVQLLIPWPMQGRAEGSVVCCEVRLVEVRDDPFGLDKVLGHRSALLEGHIDQLAQGGARLVQLEP